MYFDTASEFTSVSTHIRDNWTAQDFIQHAVNK